jgi:hypothetical protein
MTRERLNLIIRLTLAFSVALALLLSIVAARPGYRSLGAYPAVVGQPEAIRDEWNNPAVYVTIWRPAVVTPPPDWHLADQICMVVRLERGPATTSLEVPFYPPQIHWDDEPGETVMFDEADLIGKDREGGELRVTDVTLAAPISVKLPFRVNWFGLDVVPVLKDQPVGGLLCYNFTVYLSNDLKLRVPFWHQLSFTAKNVDVLQRPAYFFRFKIPADPSDPPETLTLDRLPLDEYLAQLSREYPSAVKALDAQQRDQRATETAPGQ